MYGYETIPGLGLVDAGVMNAEMVESARAFNVSASSASTVGEGGQFPKGSADFAKAVYGLQAQLYETCTQPRDGSISASLHAQCANVDGKLGNDTADQLKALPQGTWGDPLSMVAATTTLAQVISIADGTPHEQFSQQELGNVAAILDIAPKKYTAPAGGAPSGNGAVTVVTPGPDKTGVLAEQKPAEKKGAGVWLILGAAAIGMGVLYAMSQRKR